MPSDFPVPRCGGDVEVVASVASYRELIDRLKRQIRESQARAARALNSQLVMLCWSIGRDILAGQQIGGWATTSSAVSRRTFARKPARRAGSPAATCSTGAASGPCARAEENATSEGTNLVDGASDPARQLRSAARSVHLVRHEGGREPVVRAPPPRDRSPSSYTVALEPRSRTSRRLWSRRTPTARWRRLRTLACSTSSSWPRTHRSATSSRR